MLFNIMYNKVVFMVRSANYNNVKSVPRWHMSRNDLQM